MNETDIEVMIKEIEEKAAAEHTTAAELDILVSRTRALLNKHAQQLERLNALLTDLEKKLEQ